MSHLNGSKQQYDCGQKDCGQNGVLCDICSTLECSRVEHKSIKCPYKDPSCLDKRMCDSCLATRNSMLKPTEDICEKCYDIRGNSHDCDWCIDFLKTFQTAATTKPKTSMRFAQAGGGVRQFMHVPDFIPEQSVFPLSSSRVSYLCKDCVGGRDELCDKCFQISVGSIGMDEHSSNPKTPAIVFDEHVGPKRNELGPFTEETQGQLGINMMDLFDQFKKGTWQWKRQFPKLDITQDVLIDLSKKGIHAGFEGINNNCFVVVILMMFSLDIGLRSRINTNIFAGFLMRYITAKFRSSLFVDRGLIELFRKEAIELIQQKEGKSFMGVSCPNEFLKFLEDINVVNTGPFLSKNSKDGFSASFIVQEQHRPGKTDKKGNQPHDGIRFDNLPNAISHAVGSTDLPDGGIVCFQFKEQQDGTGAAKYAGSGEMMFPKKPLSVNKKRLDIVAFTHFGGSHYQIVVCLDGGYVNFNSLSAVNEGHYLPVLSILSEEDAHDIFQKNGHTVMFKCTSKEKK